MKSMPAAACLAFAALNLLVSNLLVQASTEALPCHDSGYCSVGQVKPFIGDVADSKGIQALVQARAFKKEIIVTICSNTHLVNCLQWYQNFRGVGYEHTVMLTEQRNSSDCDTMARLEPGLGCAWDSTVLPEHDTFAGPNVGVGWLHHLRHRTAARLVRMGLNVMVLDNDVLVFSDMYKFFKAAPFSRVQIFTASEDSWNINVGAIYVQNARPDGPAAWWMAEVADRVLRRAEDGGAWMHKRHLDPLCLSWEQAVFNDIWPSLVLGTPVSQGIARMWCVLPEYAPKLQWDAYLIISTNFLEHEVLRKMNGVKMFSKPLEPVAGELELDLMHLTSRMGTGDVQHALITMPNVGPSGEFHKQMGGSIYPPKRGKYSKRFVELLKSDSPSPMWPDPENGSLAAVAGNMTELWSMFPPWLVSKGNDAAKGIWQSWEGLPPKAVLGHVHAVACSGGPAKQELRRAVGRYNWSLDEALLGEQLYHTSTPLRPVPRMLALHPSIDLSKTRDWHDLKLVLQGLARVALLSARAIVWPEVPCHSTPWLSFKEHSPPFSSPGCMLPHVADGDGESDLEPSCMLMQSLHSSCLLDGKGISSSEWRHLQQVAARNSSALQLGPNSNNTIFSLHNETLELLANDNKNASHLTDVMIELTMSDVMKELYRLRSQPLVYLAHPVHVEDPKDRVWLEIFESFTKECPVLDPEKSDLNKIVPKQYTLSKGKLHKGRLKMIPREGSGGGVAHRRSVLGRLARRLQASRAARASHQRNAGKGNGRWQQAK